MTTSVITGGAGGMGLATAEIVGLNHHVFISDVNKEALDKASAHLSSKGIKNTVMVCDITDKTAVQNLMKAAHEAGRIASVIHTAGVSPQMTNADLIMKINTLGTIYVAEALLPYATEGTACVNVSSMAGYLFPNFLLPKKAYKYALSDTDKFLKKLKSRYSLFPKKSRAGVSYSISKNFVMWYSKAMSMRYGNKGARFLSVAPGSFDTAMGRLEEKSGSAKMLEFAALKRFGKPEEIAELLAFCASEKAGYLTGLDIVCDGGVTANITPRDLKKAMG